MERSRLAFGRKADWQKYTGWRVCTRVPLIVRVPPGTPGLEKGTTAGSRCDLPVNLLSLFPTLVELAKLSPKADNDGPSLVPLLRDPKNEWPHASVTFLSDAGSYGLSTKDWRLIHYANGDEELYNSAADRFELTNLAPLPAHAKRLEQLRLLAPKSFAKKVPPKDESLTKLKWRPATGKATPASKPDGDPFQVVFINQSKLGC